MDIHVSLRECIPDRWMVEPSSLSPLNGSFPKSILRIIVFWGLYWGTLVLGKYQIFNPEASTITIPWHKERG